MEPNEFAHLHVHSVYSLLDGACRLEELAAAVKANGQTACALTDHGVMYGVVPFVRTMEAAGIHPIVGCEVYVAARSRFDMEPGQDKQRFHLVLLCENMTGYRNLTALVSAAHLEGYYYKPRVDRVLLQKYHEGLICLSGCTAGEVAQALDRGDLHEAMQTVAWYQKTFGRENYFIEIQNHGLEKEKKILPRLIELSRSMGVPLAATNDVHYVHRADAPVQDVLLAIGTGNLVSDPGRLRFETKEFYLKSTQEMAQLFAQVPEAVRNTSRIAQRCHVHFEEGKLFLPAFHMEGVTDNTALFRQLCQRGLHKRYGENPSPEAQERLAHEMQVILSMGYVDYFLIVWDYIRYARQNGIPVGPGRGSGAGSLCAYCMGITQVDPLRYGLLFERFLNPERVSMPDFDIDFCIEGRQRVKDYVTQKYGADHVSEIITFDYMKAKGAIRDTGRVLGLPYALCDQAARAAGSDRTLRESLADPESPLSVLCRQDEQIRRLLQMAVRIEGTPRHPSTHAAGVLICAVPIGQIVPLQRSDETIITQYPMQVLESMGLLKFDFLGLRNLTVMRDCIRSIREGEPDFRLSAIPEDDPAVFDLLSQGDTAGVFQLESSGMRRVLMRLKPRSIEELAAVLALYRPGPRSSIDRYIQNRSHPAQITYAHPLLEPILAPTYGCLLYQEQVMEVCRRLAGYSYGRADIVRRAMSKKKHSVMEAERQVFLWGAGDGSGCVGAVANGVDEATANAIFDEIAAFASYAFNKSHAVAYALLAYQTAYLRVHYFGQDMAALMSSLTHDAAKIAEYCAACTLHGVEVVPPHVNTSEGAFVCRENRIFFGLLAVRGLGESLLNALTAERAQNGVYRDIEDFVRRMSGHGLNRLTLEALAVSGALDGMGYSRRALFNNSEDFLALSRQSSGIPAGQLGLFDQEEMPLYSRQIPDEPEFPPAECLRREREALGFYLTRHPLDGVLWLERLLHTHSSRSLSELAEGTRVMLCVCLTQVRQHRTKKGERMAFVTAEDRCGSVDIVVFPKLYEAAQGQLEPEAVFFVQGAVSRKEEQISILASAVMTPEEMQSRLGRYRLCIKIEPAQMPLCSELTRICAAAPGETVVEYYLTQQRKYVMPRPQVRTGVTRSLVQALSAVIPAAALGLVQQQSMNAKKNKI